MRPVPLLAAAALLALGTVPSLRAESLPPTIESLIENLRPEAATRGIRLPAAQPPAGQAAAPAVPIAATTAPAGVAAVSLTVNFATGSAALTPEAERVIEALARALASPQLAAFRFRVEGHTDSVGSRQLNQQLSEQRARAVRDQLTRRYGIESARLEALGLGEQQPFIATPDETAEPRNRRVQILNLGA